MVVLLLVFVPSSRTTTVCLLSPFHPRQTPAKSTTTVKRVNTTDRWFQCPYCLLHTLPRTSLNSESTRSTLGQKFNFLSGYNIFPGRITQKIDFNLMATSLKCNQRACPLLPSQLHRHTVLIPSNNSPAPTPAPDRLLQIPISWSPSSKKMALTNRY